MLTDQQSPTNGGSSHVLEGTTPASALPAAAALKHIAERMGDTGDAQISDDAVARAVADAKAVVAGEIAKLPQKQAKMLELAVLRDLSVSDAARALGISRSTAQYRYDRGLDALSKVLGVADVRVILQWEPPKRGRRPNPRPSKDARNAYERYDGPSFQDVVAARHEPEREVILTAHEQDNLRWRGRLRSLTAVHHEQIHLPAKAEHVDRHEQSAKAPTIDNDLADALQRADTIVKGSQRKLSSDRFDANPAHELQPVKKGKKPHPQRIQGGIAHKTDPNSTQHQLERAKRAEIAKYGRVLTVDEVRDLTAKERPSAQKRALEAMGIPYRQRHDKTVAVLHSDVGTFKELPGAGARLIIAEPQLQP